MRSSAASRARARAPDPSPTRRGSIGSMRVQCAAIGTDPTLARGARRAPRPRPVPEITVQLPSRLTVFLSPRSIQQVQFRARPTAALKARPVVVAKAHFGVFAAAVRTPSIGAPSRARRRTPFARGNT